MEVVLLIVTNVRMLNPTSLCLFKTKVIFTCPPQIQFIQFTFSQTIYQDTLSFHLYLSPFPRYFSSWNFLIKTSYAFHVQPHELSVQPLWYNYPKNKAKNRNHKTHTYFLSSWLPLLNLNIYKRLTQNKYCKIFNENLY